MSGPAIISPVAPFIVSTTIINPSWDKCWRSLKTTFPTSPTPKPSTKITPAWTCPVNSAPNLSISNTLPFSSLNILSFGIPIDLAVSLWAIKCLYSPWTGIKNFGLVKAITNFCSSWQACPDTWTSSNAEYTTSAPICISESTTFDTLFSLPGIGFAEIITKSFGVILTFLCVPDAILVNADIVSPWLPVVIIKSLSSV